MAYAEMQQRLEAAALHSLFSDRGALHPNIFDKYWIVDLKLSALCPSLDIDSEFFDPAIYIAGKADGPDRGSLQLAAKVLVDLPDEFCQRMKSFPLKDAWELDANEAKCDYLCFPYTHFGDYWCIGSSSAYGFMLDHFKGLQPCNDSLARLPELVSWAIGQLERHPRDRNVMNAVQERIETEKIFGPELLEDLLAVLKASPRHFTRQEVQSMTIRLNEGLQVMADFKRGM